MITAETQRVKLVQISRELRTKLKQNKSKTNSEFTVNTKLPVVLLNVKLLLANIVLFKLEVGKGWSFLYHVYVGLGTPES